MQNEVTTERISIGKAMRRKNRLARQIDVLKDVLRNENVRPESLPRSMDLRTAYNDALALTRQKISLRVALARATAPMALALAEAQEERDMAAFLKEVPTRETYRNSHCLEKGAEVDDVLGKDVLLREREACESRLADIQDRLLVFNMTQMVDVPVL